MRKTTSSFLYRYTFMFIIHSPDLTGSLSRLACCLFVKSRYIAKTYREKKKNRSWNKIETKKETQPSFDHKFSVVYTFIRYLSYIYRLLRGSRHGLRR